ncbi:hypothetical protein SDC9_118040 [bioreactor metagenome]|uniref:Uncharacterized protein n=1 Tax=bioreactor metagenome TaxID=1076179 RepID=A0A645C184_9ZZZZ
MGAMFQGTHICLTSVHYSHHFINVTITLTDDCTTHTSDFIAILIHIIAVDALIWLVIVVYPTNPKK